MRSNNDSLIVDFQGIMAISENIKFLIEEYMHQHTHRIKRRVPEVETLEAIYSETWDENIREDNLYKRIYLLKIKQFREMYELFKEEYPHEDAVLSVMDMIRETYAPYDKRNPDLTIYHPEVVLMVVLLATVTGCKDSKEYKEFWFNYNPLLQLIIPGMPSPRYMITEYTINYTLSMLPKDSFEQLFKTMFSKVLIKMKDMIGVKKETTEEPKQKYLPLYGGDGQELRSTFRKGEPSRKMKGAQGVTLMDCDHHTVLDFSSVKYKNHEVEAFKRIFDRMSIDQYGTFIFYADAINTREDFIKYLNGKGIFWFFPVKTNNGNKRLNAAIKLAFKTHPKGFRKDEVIKTSGRIETRTYRMLPMLAVGANNKLTAKTVLMVKKHTEHYLAGSEKQKEPSDSVIFYISSLDFTEQNFNQLVHSVGCRWRYEQSHNVLDTVMLQDRQALCNENHMDEVIGLNKCVFNVLTYIRQKLTERGHDLIKHHLPVTNDRRPISYKVTMMKLAENPMVAWQYIIDYFLDKPITED